MCGICGIASAEDDARPMEATVRHMSSLLQHRGPDGDGYYAAEGVALGMRRLKIIDLVTGDQPIGNEAGTVWLVFNGEIYNYRQLREALEKKGHRFRSQGDAEVIVHAYEEYGENWLGALNGMFAIALWDSTRRSLFLARDRLGIKPLFYWSDGRRLVFGSELQAVMAHRAVPREIDLQALDDYLTLEYIPAPRTILAGVRKLPPGHWLRYQDGALKLEKYWDIPYAPSQLNLEANAEMLGELMGDAVRMQLMSDVPLGAFLSGGIDSSAVVAYMSERSAGPTPTFSIGFVESSYNELPDARRVARRFGTDYHEAILEPDIATLAEQVVGQLDEPLADFSIFPTYLVAKVASSVVKVALTGDGGDELLVAMTPMWLRMLPATIAGYRNGRATTFCH
jgi:asparagine synthase (glutamine-hydrolysing)